ncbi:MAG: tRNA (N(6)-L-threonylcarbamoyladenosine(37)-C(2))-methylthiotransferase MtaB [Eubacteriales bacterium]|nr:tRNA (N(6)-L-threonylcarbamoyladenosine(37)-C(2))-methylthiotransferase MtaB [Eubacteriales bacterium]
MKKVAIHNLGCKVNSYESESMELLLRNAGYEIVPFDENVKADVYIINTCSVTNIADRKSRQMLHKAKKLNKDAVVVAAGCYVQADSEGVKKDEAVDIVLGNNMKINIVEALDNYYKDKDKDSYVTDLSHNTNYENLNIDKVNEHTRAYIKIQDGCNQFCSYCIIPYVRGRIRSRDIQDVITEVKRLSLNGYKEVVLTGIHLSSYGVDNNKGSLIEVIEAVHEIDGIERIRLGSLEPRIITDDFVMRLSKLDKVCPHFHLSLQSGCDKTLKDMNRKYTTQEYMAGCDLLRKYYDNPAITTDVIVGFPGETQENFNTTKKFLKDIGFYEMHIFKYSRRKGTVADRMSNQIDDRIKTERSSELLSLEKEMSAEYRKGYVGSSMKVLVEEKTEINNEDYYTGYTRNYIKVLIKGKDIDLLYGKASAINEIINVKIVDINHNGDILIGQTDLETEV